MVLHFKDGTSQTGYVTYEKKYVKFQESKKDKKQKIDYQLLDYTTNYISKRAKNTSREPKVFYFLPEGKKEKHYEVYELVIKGEVCLYKRTINSSNGAVWTNSMGGQPNTLMPTGSNKKKKITIYRVKRPSESYLTSFGNKDFSAAFITIVDSFKGGTAEYFEDCPILVDKIKKEEKGFTRKDMKSIVNFYNNECN